MARRHYLHPRVAGATRKDRIYWRRRRQRLEDAAMPTTRQYFNFDGSVSSILTTLTIANTDDITITAMFTLDASASGAPVLFGNSAAGNFFVGVRDLNQDTQVRLWRASGVDNGDFTGILDDTAYKVALRYTSTSGTISIDDATPVALTHGLVAASGALQIGDRSGGSNWNGRIWDVKVFTGDSQDNADLIHHWPINEGSGTLITDIVGGENGTLTAGSGTWIEDDIV